MKSLHHSRRHPDYYLRAEWHDYRSKCFYLVTFNIAEGMLPLSEVCGGFSNGSVYAEYRLSKIGKMVEECIYLLPVIFPVVEISKYCIMPDHVHILIYMKHDSDTHLGEVIRRLKSESTKAYRNAFPLSQITLSRQSIFHAGFNDKIVYKRGQLETFKNYVTDNPRRYYIKNTFPSFFNSCRNLQIGNQRYQIYGNFFLLRHPQKVSVIVSKRHSEKEKEWRRQRYIELAKDCGVYVSPFISPKEKKIRDYGLERGVKIIRIVSNGFSDRFKPSGREFELCGEGRLLLICPFEYRTSKCETGRMDCLAMNNLADEIAKAEGSMKLINAMAEIR